MIEILCSILLGTLLLAGTLMTLLGVFTFVWWLKPANNPADTSNRINKIRLWWFALTRPELFVDTFPWLKNDELDNMKDK